MRIVQAATRYNSRKAIDCQYRHFQAIADPIRRMILDRIDG
jgi:hypothetical protein